MKKSLLMSLLTFFFLIPFLFSYVDAAYLNFDKTTASPLPNETFTADVVVDAGTDQITSSDIWLVYDPAFLEAQTVANGSFFPAVTNNITSGKVSITGLIVDPGTYKTGAGVIGTVTFKALKTGTTTLSYDCRTDVSNSSKIIKNDVNATNIIECSKNASLAVNIGVGGGASSSSPGYTPPANPTSPASLPQSGIVENMSKFAAPGLILLMVGLMLRLVL